MPIKPLRVWPGVVVVVLQWLTMFGLPVIAPEQGGIAVIAGVAGGLVVLLWWLFFSRAVWLERLAAIIFIVIAVATTRRLVHESIANGMMGFMLYIYAAPVLCLALVSWAAASQRLSSGRRLASMVAASVLACGALTVVRTNGITGDAHSDFAWRWTPTAEQRLLAGADRARATIAPASPAPKTPEAPAAPASIPPPVEITEKRVPTAAGPGAIWPGFRGPGRDSVVRGVRIDTDWSRTPPVEVWRRAVGPAWSSFAVAADRFFTQEQRGDDEIVSAYSLKTGAPIWTHRDAARFWESNAGAGPRATPTLANGRVYTLGGTGILNVLDEGDGAVVWSRNAASDTGRKVPDWGIASSPLVVGDVVIVATAGLLAAYDVATGKPSWFGPKGGWGYSSPQLSTIGGVAQVVFVDGPGVVGIAPSDGTVLWRHQWAGDSIVQPAAIAGGDLLIGSGSGLADETGMLRVSVAHESSGWIVTQRWTSSGLKPYFNDFVVHKGHAFGFDGSILACLDLSDGTRKWKGGRYGHGQLLLLPDQDLLLVLSEEGELAIVAAVADRFSEVARFQVLDGKTWNHPVLVDDLLLVRNGEQMAAFRMPLAGR
jgi:outer membrane protein assembly factor BamB